MKETIRNLFYVLIVIIVCLIIAEIQFYLNDAYSNPIEVETLYPIESSTNNCDWEYIKPRAFFKRSLSYYFLDVSLIKLSYVTINMFHKERFKLIVEVKNKEKKLILKTEINKYHRYMIKSDPLDGQTLYYKIMAQFNLQKYLIKYDWKMRDIDLTVQIVNIKGKNSHSKSNIK